MSEERAAKVKRFLDWIRPKEAGLESLAGESDFLEGIEETPWSSEAEVAQARAAVRRIERDEARARARTS
jgi:hypothetical protein